MKAKTILLITGTAVVTAVALDFATGGAVRDMLGDLKDKVMSKTEEVAEVVVEGADDVADAVDTLV